MSRLYRSILYSFIDMKYKNGEDIKIGDYVRIVKCVYPTPSHNLLGKVSKIEEIFESIGSVKLSRWGVNVNSFFIEKVEDNLNDIEIELNENSIFNPEKF